MSTTLIVRHSVEDFDTWKAGFDGHEDNRRLHHSTGHRVLRDGNAITALVDFPDRTSAEEFVSDPALREVMAKAGVVGSPQIDYLESVDGISY